MYSSIEILPRWSLINWVIAFNLLEPYSPSKKSLNTSITMLAPSFVNNCSTGTESATLSPHLPCRAFTNEVVTLLEFQAHFSTIPQFWISNTSIL